MKRFVCLVLAALMILSTVALAIGPPADIAKDYQVGKMFLAVGVDTWRFVTSDGLATATTAGPLEFYTKRYDPRGQMITKRASGVYMESEEKFSYNAYLSNGNNLFTAGTTLMAHQDTVWGDQGVSVNGAALSFNQMACYTFLFAEMDSLTTSASDTAYVWVLYPKD